MSLTRLLMIAAVILATSNVGAMAQGHGAPAEPVHATAMADASGAGHGACCDEDAETSIICHFMLAILPSTTVDHGAPGLLRAVNFGSPTRLAGIEPSNPRDPPRAG